MTCVTAPGENDGAEARKPHVVIFGVDVIVKTGVWDTCTWDWTDVLVSFARMVTVRDCKNLLTPSPLLSLGRLTRSSSREGVCSLSISLYTLNLALLSLSSLLSLNSYYLFILFYYLCPEEYKKQTKKQTIKQKKAKKKKKHCRYANTSNKNVTIH